jgi:hypothetical protein
VARSNKVSHGADIKSYVYKSNDFRLIIVHRLALLYASAKAIFG